MSTFRPQSTLLHNWFSTLIVSLTLVPGLLSSNVGAQDFINWQFNLEGAKTTAAESDRLVLIHFAASWCAPCKELDRFVFSNPQTVRVVTTDVVPVYVDVDKHPEIANKFSVESIPADVIITPAGHIIANRASPRSNDGYIAMIKNAIQRDKTLSADVANQIDEMRNAAKASAPRNSVQRNGMEFQVDDWHTKIESDKTVGGGNFVPQSPEKPAVNQTTGWQAPTTFRQNNVSQIGTSNDNAMDNRKVSTFPNQMLTPAIENQDPGPKRIVNRFTQQEKVESKPPANLETITPSPLTPMKDTSAESVAEAPTKSEVQSTASSLPPTGLEGYCPVTLINDGSWTKGDRKWGCIHRGRLYLFTSKENRDQFRMTPDMFSPLLGGADPVVYQQNGQLENGKRETGVFYGEDTGPKVIILFSSMENQAKFKAEPAKYLGAVRQAMSRLDRGTKMR